MSEQQKDYSLLRPFDMEAAKRGEAICFQGIESSTSVTYIAGPDKGANIICDVCGYFKEYFHTALRMAPLCWVEGKPVYKGDVLYDKHHGTRQEVRCAGSHETLETVQPRRDGSFVLCLEDATWTQPKVKREGWVNIYPAKKSGVIVALASHVYSSKAAADAVAAASRIDCIRIEWEEPAELENGK